MTWYRLPIAVTVVAAVLAAAASAQPIRWGDKAGSLQGGSFELSFEKRLFEPGPTEEICMRCKHYAELRVGTDEQDFGAAEFDITHVIAGYRYYAYVQLKEGPRGKPVDGGLAAYLGAGLGHYELDPGEPVSGWSFRVGLDIKVTDECKNGEPAGWFMDWEVSSTYHRLWVPGPDFDYWNLQTGPRITFPSRRDRQRAVELGACRESGPD